MAEIQEYLPQVDAQQPLGGVSPNIELAGAVGRGIERLGGAIEEGAGEIHRRQASEETADVYANFADQRAQFTAKVQQGIQDGTLNNDKLLQEYDDSTGKMQDNISTPEGKNYFERQQSRLRGHLLQMATVGQAQIAANVSKGKWASGVSQTSSTLMADPSQFEDAIHQGVESVDALIESGGLPEKFREKAIQEMGTEYAKGAVRGHINMSPEETLKTLEKGDWSQFLNTDQTKQLIGEAKMAIRANDADDTRVQKSLEKAKKLKEEKWGSDHFQGLQEGTLSAKDVIDAVQKGTLSPEKGEHYIAAIKKEAAGENKTDPAVYKDYLNRVGNLDDPNPILSADDLLPAVREGKLAVNGPNSFSTLKMLLNNTPEGQAMVTGRKSLMKQAEAAILYKNELVGHEDPYSRQKYNQFIADFAHGLHNLPPGAKPSDLVDPNNPLYFGNKLDSYVVPVQERLQRQFQQRTDKANEDSKTKKKPGESIMDNLKRNGDIR